MYTDAALCRAQPAIRGNKVDDNRGCYETSAASAADVPMRLANAPNVNAQRGLIPMTMSVFMLITSPIMVFGKLGCSSVIKGADATVCDAPMTTNSVNET